MGKAPGEPAFARLPRPRPRVPAARAGARWLVLLLLLAGTARAAGIAAIEAEDRRFVTLRGSWEFLDEAQAREGGAAGLLSVSPGSTLRVDFDGRHLAVRALRGEMERRTRIAARPPLNEFRSFPAAVVHVSVDGGATATLDLSGRKGWEEEVLATGLPEGRHFAVLELVSGTLFVDRFLASDAPFARVRARVVDETGVSVADAAVEFRSPAGLVAALRCGRDGDTGVACSVPPGTCTAAAFPDDAVGIDPVFEIVDDPRMPHVIAGARVEAGRTLELEFRLPYRDRFARPCGAVLRPALGAPVTRTPGGTFPLALRKDPGGELRAALLDSKGGEIALSVGAPVRGPDGPFRPVALPPGVAPGSYGLRVLGKEIRDEVPAAVHVVAGFPSSYRIAHLSDAHVKALRDDWGAWRTLLAVARDIEAMDPRPAFAVLTGDLTDSGVPSQFLRARSALAAFRVPLYVCRGNHDCIDGGASKAFRGAEEWVKYMGATDYSETFGRDRFAVLSTGYYEAVGEERASWLESALGREAGPGLKGIFFHFDYTTEAEPGGRATQAELSHLAGRVGANLLLSGHIHRHQARRASGALALAAPALVDGGWQVIEVRDGAPAGVEVRKTAKPGREAPGKSEFPPAAWLGAAGDGSGPEALSRIRRLCEEGFGAEDLVPGLSDPDACVRRASAQRIAALGLAKQAREALEAALRDADPLVREEAALALGTGTRAASLKAAVADSDPRVRIAAVKALAQVRGKGAQELLLEALADPWEEAAWLAATVLGEFRTRGIEDAIGKRVSDRGLASRARVALVWALSEHEKPEASRHLAPLLEDADDEVRAHAALVLGEWEDWRAVPELIRLTEEGRPEQQDDARRILKKITGEDRGTGSAKAREAWEAWWERTGKAKAREGR